MKRRDFLKSAAFAAGLPLLTKYSELAARAQATSSDDYKAIVLLYMFGGNDSNNMLIPIDPMNYQLYAASRTTLALPQNTLLPLADSAYAVHPSMPEIQQLYASGNLAFIANAGPLVVPTTKSQYMQALSGAGTTPLPQSLFSHPDQATLAQTGGQLSSEQTGWGGKMIDAISSQYSASTLPEGISYAGAATFINGPKTNGYIAPSASGSWPCNLGAQCSVVQAAAQDILACDSSVVMVQTDQNAIGSMYKFNEIYANALANQPVLKSVQGTSSIGALLAGVALMMQARQRVSAQRQVFFVGIGSFDTHANQLAYHANMLRSVSTGVGAFYNMLVELNLLNNVTLLSSSDFNRTLQANATSGSDHAWGGHHFLMGGAVKGKQIYGSFPVLEVGGPQDIGDNIGQFIPTTSISQIGANLATWFGVPQNQISTIFPSASAFPSLSFS